MTTRSIPRTVTELGQGTNACLIYADGDDPVRMALPYTLAGLQAGERCVYVLGDHEPEFVLQALRDAGLDVEREIARGALVLLAEWEAGFPDGEFDPVAMIAFVREAIADALASGFSGLRITAEMTWALRLGIGHNQLIHYEALGAGLYPDEPLTALCMYNRSRFPAEVCHDALRCHPLVVQGEQTYPNLYYELPDRLLAPDSVAAKLDWMLEQLSRLREAEDERLALVREQAARNEAEARVEARDEFISVAAHELKTPLTSVLGFARLAERRLELLCDADRAVMSELITTVHAEGRRLGDLLDRLLDVTRIDAGRFEIETERLDLRELTERVLARMRLAIACPVRFSAPETPVPIMGDRMRLEQVLGNLLSNALNHGSSDGPIEVSLWTAGREARLAVRDHGPGVREADRECIFQRHNQGNGSGGGMGLGLYIAREIINRHRGRIHVEHAEGGGARFVVALPLAP